MRFSLLNSVTCAIILSLGHSLLPYSAPIASAAQAETSAAQAEKNGPAERPTADEVIAKSGVPVSAVAAVVNESVVTTFDVRQRMKMMVISSGGQLPPDAMPQIQTQAVRDLIEERLKLQETRKYDLEISDEEIAEELTLMAGQSKLTLDQMLTTLEAAGISINSLKEQIRAQVAWPQLVSGRYRDRVRVSDDEVENTLGRMREDASKEQFLVSEICIPVSDPAQAQQYYQGSLQLIEQMRKGVPFSVVAQQFSACTTAAVGGDLGWVRAGELSEELDTALRDLPPGSVTNPIASEGAFMILAVRDKRQAAIAGEPTFTLAYAGAEESMGGNAARAALDKLGTAEVCAGRALRIDLGKDVGYGLLENVTLGKIDERFRPFVEDLDRGEQSTVIEADGAYHSVYVCDKDEGLGLPSRAALENRIYSRQIARIAQQYLRDVERDSMVDIRMKNLLQPNG